MVLLVASWRSALADQLYGDQHRHKDVRGVRGSILSYVGWKMRGKLTSLVVFFFLQKIVDYLEQHRDDFEPFMEDEEKFDKVR